MAPTISQLFWRVLFAADKPAFEAGIAELEIRPEFKHPLLAERLESIKPKKEGLSVHFADAHPPARYVCSRLRRR